MLFTAREVGKEDIALQVNTVIDFYLVGFAVTQSHLALQSPSDGVQAVTKERVCDLFQWRYHGTAPVFKTHHGTHSNTRRSSRY